MTPPPDHGKRYGVLGCLVEPELCASTCRAMHRKRRGPEQALLTGCTVGLTLGTLGLPFAEAAFGAAGLRIALIWDMVNVFAGAQWLRSLPLPTCTVTLTSDTLAPSGCLCRMGGRNPFVGCYTSSPLRALPEHCMVKAVRLLAH